MDRNEFVALVRAFEHAYDRLIEKINAMSPDELRFVPSIADAWSSNEHLVHLLDADCNLVLRIRGAVAEPGLKVPAWNQEAWRAKNNYEASDGIFCLDLAVALRKILAESLRHLSDEAWRNAFIIHPERGELKLVDVLKIYTDHADSHLRYLERNSKAYAETKVASGGSAKPSSKVEAKR